MRRCLVLLVSLSVLVPCSTQAQVLERLPAINDAEPQMVYRFVRGWDRLYVDSATEIDVPDVQFRSLTNYYDLGGWSAAQRGAGAITDMYRTDPWVSGFSPLGWDPLPYRVDGLAWIPNPGRLVACAWDEGQNVSIILGIDEETGAFELLATLPEGLRFSGLAYSYSGLAGVTRDLQTNVSAVYLIDVGTWATEHLVDLPAPCEALGPPGGGDLGWIAAGERVFRVLGADVTELPVEPFGGELGTIVAIGDWFGFSPVEPATWGRIKRQYR